MALSAHPVLHKIYRVFLILAVLACFLLALSLLGGGFKLLSKDVVEDVFRATNNPIVSLFIGLFATALMQSSSTTTSIVVTLVATGTISFQNAVPMIMGANIGTSVTSTIVALGHLHSKKEFRHAISAATVHDFFNILVVISLLSFELLTGYLSRSALYLTSLLPIFDKETSGFSLMGATIKPLSTWIISILGKNPLFILPLSLTILIVSLRGFTQILKSFMIGKSQAIVDKYVFGHPMKSLFWGVLITAGVQSSSVTASLTVPLVASNRASLKKVFPFLIGANVGTTFTALIAAISQNEIALAIAIVHVLFNLFGVLVFFPIPQIRNVPVFLAEKLGELSEKYRAAGILYVLIIFFIIPLLFVSFS